MNIHRKINRKAYADDIFRRQNDTGFALRMIKKNYNHPYEDTLPNDGIYTKGQPWPVRSRKRRN